MRNRESLSVPIQDHAEAQVLFGQADVFLKIVEDSFNAKVILKSDGLNIVGNDSKDVRRAGKTFESLLNLVRSGQQIDASDVKHAVRASKSEILVQSENTAEAAIPVFSKRGTVRPKTPGQRRYVEAIKYHDLVFGIGPAGTGKTYLAMAMAVSALKGGQISRILWKLYRIVPVLTSLVFVGIICHLWTKGRCEMAKNAPGKHYRNGITLIELLRRFPDDAMAEKWFIEHRWENRIRCAYCDSANVNTHATHATMPYRCRSCGKRFSVKTNSVMHASNLGYQKWVIAIYLIITNLKGVSSMKLHRDLGITQRTAWHLLHRIRKAYDSTNDVFAGEVEVDEMFVGGREGNKHSKKKLRAGRGTVGKTVVAGLRQRGTSQVTARVVDGVDRQTLQGFVIKHTTPDTTVYTDQASAYRGLPREHGFVAHSIGEYVREQVHTNGIESFWSMFKRGYKGVYHKMSVKHLNRYISEFLGRHNRRRLDTDSQMADWVRCAQYKRLTYQALVA